MQDELKRNLYQKDLRKLKQIIKLNDNKNNALTDIITSNNDDNLVSTKSSNASQILSKNIEGIQKTKSDIIEQNKLIVDENSDLDEYINNDKDNTDDNTEKNKNTPEMNYIISSSKKENIDFINTLLKLKGIEKEKYNSNKIHKKELKHSEKNINQKKIYIDKIANNNNKFIKDNSDDIYEYQYNEKNLTDVNKYLKKYSPDLEMLKKTYEKNKNKSINKNNTKSNYINKTLSSKKKKRNKK